MKPPPIAPTMPRTMSRKKPSPVLLTILLPNPAIRPSYDPADNGHVNPFPPRRCVRHRLHLLSQAMSGMLLIFCGTNTGSRRIPLAHIGAALCCAVILVTIVMVDL